MKISVRYDPTKGVVRIHTVNTTTSHVGEYGSDSKVAFMIARTSTPPQIEFSVGEVGSTQELTRPKKARKRKCQK